MKRWLYLVLFVSTVLVFPLLFEWLVAPYSKINFWPILLVMIVLTPILARYLGIAFGNKQAGYRGGSALKAAFWQTIIYWLVALSVTVVLIYFLGGFQ
jgi:hypothetical protein